MSTPNLFDTPAEKAKDQEFREQRDKERNSSKATSLFARGHPSHYHKSDEEYPAEFYYQLYPGLVVEIVIANPYSLVARGHVEPVLTRVHSVNCFGKPTSMTFGIGGYVNFNDLPKPIRCFPQRRNWGVVGDHIILQLNSGTHYVDLMDVDNITIHASDHPKVRVVEHQPNRPAKVTNAFVGQLAHKKEWLDSLAQDRLQTQLGAQYPNWWASTEGEQPPVPPVATAAPRSFAFAQAQRLRIMKLKLSQSRQVKTPAKPVVLTEGWSTGGKGGEHYFLADGSALCNRSYKPGFLYGFKAVAPKGACKKCLKKLADNASKEKGLKPLSETAAAQLWDYQERLGFIAERGFAANGGTYEVGKELEAGYKLLKQLAPPALADLAGQLVDACYDEELSSAKMEEKIGELAWQLTLLLTNDERALKGEPIA